MLKLMDKKIYTILCSINAIILTYAVRMRFIGSLLYTAKTSKIFSFVCFQKVTGNDASDNATGFINLLLLALAVFSTVYNVVLYVIFNPSFKRAIKGILNCSQSTDLQEQQRTDERVAATSFFPTDGGLYM